ncbi:MAG TPA: DcrB-related protein [Bryobacteraceae bacterium]|jgi:hypothetical protein|nr:DcrB-related protein [Bryobacteraceae bacterium]
MKTFNAPSAYLQTPDDWADVSSYILAAPKVAGFAPTVIVNIMRQVIVRELQKHIDQQVYEMQKLSGFKLLQRQPVVVTSKGQTGFVAFSHDNNQRGPEVYQKQVYYMVGQTIWVLTATSPASIYPLVMPALEGVMGTFQPKDWEGGTGA